MPNRILGPVLFCGDPHGQFRQIIEAAGRMKASAVVILGDMEPQRPLDEELAPLLERSVPLHFIHGNHDADSDVLWLRVWRSKIADHNVHGRVVELPDGRRLAGLGGVFREAVWHPGMGAPKFRTRSEHARATPRMDRWQGGPHRKHAASIYPAEVDQLSELEADILVTHEAPSYHPHGFSILDALVQAMGVKVTVHGHHHDALDSSARWSSQGFRTYGVGLRGISAHWPDGRWEVIVAGEIDRIRCQSRFVRGSDEA